MSDANLSKASKKTPFLFVKQKGNPSSDSFLVDFPDSYESLMNSIQKKFKGKINVRCIYNQNGIQIKSIDDLPPGSTVFASSKLNITNKTNTSKTSQHKNSPQRPPQLSPRISKTPHLPVTQYSPSKSQILSNDKKKNKSSFQNNKISPKSQFKKAKTLRSSSNTIPPIRKGTLNKILSNTTSEDSPIKIESEISYVETNSESNEFQYPQSTSQDDSVPFSTSILATNNANDNIENDSDDFGDLATFTQNNKSTEPQQEQLLQINTNTEITIQPLNTINDNNIINQLPVKPLSSNEPSINIQINDPEQSDSFFVPPVRKTRRRKTFSTRFLRSTDSILQPPPVSPIQTTTSANTSCDESEKAPVKSDTDDRIPLSPLFFKNEKNHTITSTMAFSVARNRKRRSNTTRTPYASSQMQFTPPNNERMQMMKLKSIESAIEALTYFSSRNDIQNPIQANIMLDDDDDIYGKPDKEDESNKEEKGNDALDEFRDSDGSDLFGSDDQPLILINDQITPTPILNLNDTRSSNGSSIPFHPVPYDSPIKIQNNPPSMNSPDNLDDFIESDDDLSFDSDDLDSNKITPITPFHAKDLLIDNNNNDDDDDYFYDSDEEETDFQLPPQVLKDNNKLFSKSSNIEQLKNQRSNAEHQRSSSKGSYYIYDTVSFDIPAIIDGSLQTSESTNSANLLLHSDESKQTPRIPKKPSVPNLSSFNKSKKSDNGKFTNSSELTNTPTDKTRNTKKLEIKTAIQSKMKPKVRYASPPFYKTVISTTTKKRTMISTKTKKKKIKNHYEEKLNELQKTASDYKTDEDKFFELIDKLVGDSPHEILDIPQEVSVTTLLPIMQNQQGLAWAAQGSLLASLQGMPEVEPNVLGYDDMVEKANSIITKHQWKFRSPNRSMMSPSIHFNVAIVGPSNSGKSTFLRILTDQLIAEFVENGLWRNSFVFIMNMENLSFALHQKQENNDAFHLQQLYKTIVKITISSILWHFQPLLGTTKSLTKYFESFVSRKHSARSFPTSISEHDSELTEKLENIANVIGTLWNTETAFEQFVTAVLLFPKEIAEAFQVSNPVFIIDHFDVCHIYLEPPTRFKQSSGFWLIDIMKTCFIENTNFLIASKRDDRFYESTFLTRKGVDLYPTTEIIDKSSPLIENSKGFNFSLKTDDSEDPIVIKSELCGGSPSYLNLWNEMNHISDEYSEFRMPEMYDELISKANSLIENVFVDENGKKPKIKIKSVKKLKRKQKRKVEH